jgi:hypothetical protein
MEEKRQEDLLIPIGNPKKVKIKANFYKCMGCGKELIEPSENLKIAKKIDELNKQLEEGKTIKNVSIDEGTIIC